jgi:hypothetical protein
MAKHWTEPLDPERHIDFMGQREVGGRRPETDPNSRLRGDRAYFVRVSGFTFQFVSLDQMRDCLAWFELPIHPSSATPFDCGEHYWQAWHERLPKGLTRNPRRKKIVAALEEALTDFGEVGP